MTIYYRVDIATGITTEEQKTGFYSKSPELNVSVFKGLRAAKRKFDELSKAEIARLKDMRKKFKAFKFRDNVIESTTAHAGDVQDHGTA